jgi:ketosteroid isomerase-like protein
MSSAGSYTATVSDYGALVGRWWAVWYNGDIDTLDEILAEKFVRHGHTGTVIRTRQQAKADMLQYRESMEIADVRIEAQAVSGDSVWSRVTTTGVRRRTEEPTTVSWLQLCRVEDGRLAEMWMLYALGIDWSKR